MRNKDEILSTPSSNMFASTSRLSFVSCLNYISREETDKDVRDSEAIISKTSSCYPQKSWKKDTSARRAVSLRNGQIIYGTYVVKV